MYIDTVLAWSRPGGRARRLSTLPFYGRAAILPAAAFEGRCRLCTFQGSTRRHDGCMQHTERRYCVYSKGISPPIDCCADR